MGSGTNMNGSREEGVILGQIFLKRGKKYFLHLWVPNPRRYLGFDLVSPASVLCMYVRLSLSQFLSKRPEIRYTPFFRFRKK